VPESRLREWLAIIEGIIEYEKTADKTGQKKKAKGGKKRADVKKLKGGGHGK